MLRRVFDEHFVINDNEESAVAVVRAKRGDELRANSLQSPDHWEAIFREKQEKVPKTTPEWSPPRLPLG
jgi:hypothetical protein